MALRSSLVPPASSIHHVSGTYKSCYLPSRPWQVQRGAGQDRTRRPLPTGFAAAAGLAPGACGCRCPRSGPLSVRRGLPSHPALNQPLVFVQPGDKAVSRFSMTKRWPVPRSPPQGGEMGQGGAAACPGPEAGLCLCFHRLWTSYKNNGVLPPPSRPGPDLHLALKLAKGLLSVQPAPAPAAPPPPGLRHCGHP